MRRRILRYLVLPALLIGLLVVPGFAKQEKGDAKEAEAIQKRIEVGRISATGRAGTPYAT